MKLFTVEISMDYFACIFYKYTTALAKNQIKNAAGGCEPLQVPTFLKTGALLRLAKRSVINAEIGN